MKYKKGSNLTLIEALRQLVCGGAVIDGEYSVVVKIVDGAPLMMGPLESSFSSHDLVLSGPLYEAIPEPDYNLTFMEAWDKAKAGHAIEHENGVIVRYGPNTAISYGLYAVGQSMEPTSFWLDAKYRVVDPA